MTNKITPKKVILCGILYSILSLPSQASVLYDLDTAVLDGGTGANTFARGATSLATSGSDLNFQLGTNSYVVAYFNAFTLANAGDRITLSFTYTSPADAFASADAAFRIGMFHSDGVKITENGGTNNSAFNEYRGAGAMLRARAGTLGSSNTFYERKADGSGTTLWSSGLYTAVPSSPTLAQVATGGNTVSYAIERLADDSLQYSIAYTGTSGAESFSIISASPATYTFDTLSIFGNPVSATTPTLSLSSLEVTAIPEPGAVGLALLVLGGTLLLRRRFIS